MIKVKNKSLLDKYVTNTGISKLFSQNINNLLELFFRKQRWLFN